jgi:hypothetical protein
LGYLILTTQMYSRRSRGTNSCVDFQIFSRHFSEIHCGSVQGASQSQHGALNFPMLNINDGTDYMQYPHIYNMIYNIIYIYIQSQEVSNCSRFLLVTPNSCGMLWTIAHLLIMKKTSLPCTHWPYPSKFWREDHWIACQQPFELRPTLVAGKKTKFKKKTKFNLALVLQLPWK